MRIRKLNIHSFRNLKSTSLIDFQDFNFIHGLNGSGKTSILEAIHTLALTRSFRSRKMQTVISFDQDALTVRGEFDAVGRKRNGAQQPPEDISSIGVRRSRQDLVLVKVNGEKLGSVGQLAGVLPVQVINPASFELLEGSPGVRRQFLDWGVFHVKHSGFFELWPRYRKALQQRNSLLRRGNIDAAALAPWDAELSTTAALITAARLRHFDELAIAFDSVYRQLLRNSVVFSGLDDLVPDSMPALSLEFFGGWKDFDERGYAEVLKDDVAQDLRAGFTRSGPHRADIDLKCGKLRAGEVLSRGQIKTIVCALKLAQSKVLLDQGIPTVFLIDDLAAELDEGRCRAVFSELVDLDVQVFATAVKESDLHNDWCRDKPLKRFHVEHGIVTPLM